MIMAVMSRIAPANATSHAKLITLTVQSPLSKKEDMFSCMGEHCSGMPEWPKQAAPWPTTSQRTWEVSWHCLIFVVRVRLTNINNQAIRSWKEYDLKLHPPNVRMCLPYFPKATQDCPISSST